MGLKNPPWWLKGESRSMLKLSVVMHIHTVQHHDAAFKDTLQSLANGHLSRDKSVDGKLISGRDPGWKVDSA